MPRKYYKSRRKPRSRRRKSRVPRSIVPSGMPKTRRTNLRYCDSLNLTSTAGILGSYVFSANSAYDPNYTDGGHQPMGFDQWSLLFNHCIVLGSKITVQISPDATNTSPAWCGIYLTDGTAVPYTTAPQFKEARKGIVKAIAPAQHKEMLNYTFSAKNFFNVKDVADNSQLGASIGADPLERAFYNIWYQTTDGTTKTLRILVTVDYIVEFREPKDVATS